MYFCTTAGDQALSDASVCEKFHFVKTQSLAKAGLPSETTGKGTLFARYSGAFEKQSVQDLLKSEIVLMVTLGRSPRMASAV